MWVNADHWDQTATAATASNAATHGTDHDVTSLRAVR